ncbi:aldehyde:ferredoxin oxidoreductase [bacterium]|nr:aldehyde:ferredoxin oxidoreductase [bacterium]
MFGFHQKYLKIDVESGSFQEVPISTKILRKFIGGVGLGAWILFKESKQGSDSLSPGAPLIFCFSPLVGTPLTTSAKFAVLAKSPLTNRISDALSSSHFAIEGKKTGFDAIVITGRSKTKKVVVIEDGKVTLQDAEDLQGLSAIAASEKLKEKLGVGYQIASIGIAGENQVLFANLSHERRHAGRGGLGAVLGSKNIKAIAVKGSLRIPVAAPVKLVEKARELSAKSFGPATAKYRELGTVSNLLVFNRLSVLPTRNFQEGHFKPIVSQNFQDVETASKVTRHSCAACTIGCEHIYQGKQGKVRIEYESMFALGSLCGIENPDEVAEIVGLCDDFGLDTISTGGTIAFAMECVEKGLLDEPWLRFGDGEAVKKAVTLIAGRKGIGEILSLGSRQAAQLIGQGSIAFAPQVKGLEIPGYEPRGLQTMALGLAVASRGADHNRSGAYEADFSPDSGRLIDDADFARSAADSENRSALIDSLILCKFLRGIFTDFFAESTELLSLVTGWEFNEGELKTAAERVVAIKKLFNIREGWDCSEDTLPERFFTQALETLSGGVRTLSKLTLQNRIKAYYKIRNWDEDGKIGAQELKRLGLDDLFEVVT